MTKNKPNRSPDRKDAGRPAGILVSRSQEVLSQENTPHERASACQKWTPVPASYLPFVVSKPFLKGKQSMINKAFWGFA